MKYVKILGLLAVAASALMAFTASALATTITAPTGTPYTKGISATSEGHVTLKTFVNIQCHSSVSGESLTHGSGQTARGEITSLTWGTSGNLNGTCTNSWHVTTEEEGELEIHYKAAGEGTLTSRGTRVHTTRFGVDCYYETSETHIGTFTDSHKTGKTATLHVDAEIPIHPNSEPLCGSGRSEWEGAYEVHSPDTIYVDQ